MGMCRNGRDDPLFHFVRVMCNLPFLLPSLRFSFASHAKTITRTPLPFAGGFRSGSELSVHAWKSPLPPLFRVMMNIIFLICERIRVIQRHLAAKVLIARRRALREVEEEYQG